MSKWSLVEATDGRLTLENLYENWITIKREHLERLAILPLKSEEFLDYMDKAQDLKKAWREATEEDGPTTRRVFVSWDPAGTSNHCISSIQLLFREEGNVMNVYFRSSSFEWFSSDLRFIAKLAMEIEIDTVQISVGSWHLYLE